MKEYRKHIILILLAFLPLMAICSPFLFGKDEKIIVDKSGKGNFITIQSAINSLPDFSGKPRIIFIKNGTYAEKISITKNNVVLEGESRENTIVLQSISRDEWRCQNGDDWGVATINVDGNDITLKNLMVINNFGFENKKGWVIDCPSDTSSHKKTLSPTGHQMALRTMKATRFKAVNVHFKAFGGDTVSPWNVEDGMFYFKDCIMEGGVDFYCPRGWAYAEDCKFIAHSGLASIWHDGSVNEDSKTVLKNCTFEGFEGFNLGRYHKDAQFYLIDCGFSKEMANKDIYLVPTSNVIQWGRRVYYSNCHREGGDFDWFKDNFSEAKNAPVADDINASWVFGNRWNPVSDVSFATHAILRIINPAFLHRKDELVILKRNDLEKKLGKISDGKFIDVQAKEPVAIQFDDLDGDGKWDEAIFLYSFKSKENVDFRVSISDVLLSANKRTNVRLAKKTAAGHYGMPLQKEVMADNAQPNDFTKNPIPLYQVEGPVWENDKVAFRSYFDVRNAKDIFGKTTTAMVMDTVGTYGDKYYHSFDKNWGMDILKVGNSLGAGGIAVLVDKNGKDTLVKLAGNNIGKTSYELVTRGPVRSVFRIHYQDWIVEGKNFQVTEEISIWGGQYFYEDKVSIAPEATLVTGIVNLHSKTSNQLKEGKANVLFTFDKQSENNDFLGMGIISRNPLKKFGEALLSGNGITNTYTMEFNSSTQPVVFRFFSAWEKTDPSFKNKKYFENLLITESLKWNNPIKLNWIE